MNYRISGLDEKKKRPVDFLREVPRGWCDYVHDARNWSCWALTVSKTISFLCDPLRPACPLQIHHTSSFLILLVDIVDLQLRGIDDFRYNGPTVALFLQVHYMPVVFYWDVGSSNTPSSSISMIVIWPFIISQEESNDREFNPLSAEHIIRKVFLYFPHSGGN